VAPSRDDAASRLWWAIKRYALLSVVIVAACTLLAAEFGPGGEAPRYRAGALVIASELEGIRPEHLPRMAAAIFTGGTVAQNAVTIGRLDIEPHLLIPLYADLEPIAGTVLMRVVGYSTDPEEASLIANSAARALTAELNKSGPGVGRFVIQEQSRPPELPEPGTSFPPALIGLVAGLLLAFGTVGLLMVFRRPVLAGDEAREVVGAPLLGALRMRRGRSRAAEPTEVMGLSALIKQLYPDRRGVCVFVGPRGNRNSRTRVAEIVTRGLARSGLVYFVPGSARQSRDAGQRLAAVDEVIVSPDMELDASFIDIPVVVDGPSTDELDVPQFLPPDTRTVLVLGEGTPRRRLELAARQFLPGELTGMVFVPEPEEEKGGSGSAAGDRGPARRADRTCRHERRRRR
jgi:hypothetical protein